MKSKADRMWEEFGDILAAVLRRPPMLLHQTKPAGASAPRTAMAETSVARNTAGMRCHKVLWPANAAPAMTAWLKTVLPDR